MKNIIMNVVIVFLIVANIVLGSINYYSGKPKCLCDGCDRVRVTDSRYCHKHEDLKIERVVWQEAKIKSLN